MVRIINLFHIQNEFKIKWFQATKKNKLQIILTSVVNHFVNNV